jgi:CheY-like chemotaxis protein
MRRLQQVANMITEDDDRSRILVVDDDRGIRELLGRELRGDGHRVDLAKDGYEALNSIHECRYDIAFVDLRMPGIGGLQLLRSLRSFSPDTAVVILTAFGSVQESVQAMKLGAVDFVEKPFDPAAIRRLTEEILLRRKPDDTKTVAELLHLADLAYQRQFWAEAHAHAKSAMLRAPDRAEPPFLLGRICEGEGDASLAPHYYYMALEVDHAFQPAVEALRRLGRIRGDPEPVPLSPTRRSIK